MSDSADELVVVGPGVLGLLAARMYRDAHPAARVTLKFRRADPSRAAGLQSEGFTVISSEGGEAATAPRLLFCAPPTGNSVIVCPASSWVRNVSSTFGLWLQDYAGCVADSLTQHWSPASRGATAVFTSSGSVYSEDGGGTVTEESEVGNNERAARLVSAEAAVAGAGGAVLRLGGLYRQV